MRTPPVAVVACLLLPLVPARGGTVETAAADEPMRIGLPSVFTGSHYHAALSRAAQDEALKLGARVEVTNALGDPLQQRNDLDDLVAQGVRGLVLSPMPGVTPAIEGAVKAGVPVVTVDTRADTDKVLFHSGVDNVEVGRLAARFVVEKLGNKGTVIELEGPPGYASAVDRKAGFDEVIRSSGVKLLASQNAGWLRSQGRNVTEALMKQHPSFDAVFAANDDMMFGAFDAMSAGGIDPSTKVTVSADATPQALDFVKAGKLGATVDGVPEKQARQAVRYLVDYIKNKAMPPQRVMLVKPELITKAQLPGG